MTTQPILISLMSLQIVQNHMNLLIGRIIPHDLLHKSLALLLVSVDSIFSGFAFYGFFTRNIPVAYGVK